jgi:uncharacterized protein DUF4035
LGCTVAELLERVDAFELLEWQVFYALDPFDETRADRRAARIAQVVYNMMRGANTQPAQLDQFLLYKEATPEETPQQTAQRLRSQLLATGRVRDKRRKVPRWQH